ncbi:GDSL-type esterase/lipase family protein [Rhodococcus erythropolis]|uniref:GDSL-type esterase/lipase family protein n=1 Tax=Rhodococcus erythropolis TaxID=1833 RepID=UPI00366B00B3
MTVGKQLSGSAVEGKSLREITFGGQPGVTAGPGSDIVSDPVPLDFDAWEPLSLSIFVPGLAALPTEHFNGNATSFYSPPGSGDLTTDASGAPLALSTTSVPLASGLDVLAPDSASTLVAFGDSITDGYGAGDILGVPNPLGFPQAAEAIDADARYPDFLQRRIDEKGLPISVANAGVSGNRVIASGFIPQFADSMVARLQNDVLDVPSVTDVVILGGVNDLGFPIGASFEQLTAGYMNLIDRLHTAGIAVHLGTIPPASNAMLDGILTLPPANPVRLRVNEWIRTQTMADSVADFDAALRDSVNPDVMTPPFAGSDNLHPSAAGYEKMAAAVDLTRLKGSTC